MNWHTRWSGPDENTVVPFWESAAYKAPAGCNAYRTDSKTHAVGFVCAKGLLLGHACSIPKSYASKRIGGHDCMITTNQR